VDAQGHEHRHRPVGETLLSGGGVEQRIAKTRGQPQAGLAPEQAQHQPDDERRQAAVRVDEQRVAHRQQELGEQQHVHQVRAQVSGEDVSD